MLAFHLGFNMMAPVSLTEWHIKLTNWAPLPSFLFLMGWREPVGTLQHPKQFRNLRILDAPERKYFVGMRFPPARGR